MVVDDGARRALVERGTSLLPAGVRFVQGAFDEGDAVDVAGPEGDVFARGMVAIDAVTLRGVAGRRTADLPPDVATRPIHRDDLVVLPRRRGRVATRVARRLLGAGSLRSDNRCSLGTAPHCGASARGARSGVQRLTDGRSRREARGGPALPCEAARAWARRRR